MTSTTIRVPRDLHERLSQHAAAEGTSLAGAIERALDAEERAAFWGEVRATMTTPAATARISADAAALDGTLRDGLDPDERWDDVL